MSEPNDLSTSARCETVPSRFAPHQFHPGRYSSDAWQHRDSEETRPLPISSSSHLNGPRHLGRRQTAEQENVYFTIVSKFMLNFKFLVF